MTTGQLDYSQRSEAIKENRKKYYYANRAAELERARQYYQDHKEEKKAQANPRLYEWLKRECKRYCDWRPNQYVSDKQYDSNHKYLTVIYNQLKSGAVGLNWFFDQDNTQELIILDPHEIDSRQFTSCTCQ